MTDDESVNIHYAKTHLSALIQRVREGQTITIAHAGNPVARLVAIEQVMPRRPGGFSFEMADDFNAPLPDEELEAWEG